MQDLVVCFDQQFAQAREIENFFRNRYRPRTVYEERKTKGDTYLIQVCMYAYMNILFNFIVLRWLIPVGDPSLIACKAW